MPPYLRPCPLCRSSPRHPPLLLIPLNPPFLWRQLLDLETGTFTYLLVDSLPSEAAQVDPVLEQLERDLPLRQELGLSLRFCLETHLHADHITGAGQSRCRTGCRLLVPEAPGINNATQLRGGECLRLGSLPIEVRAMPGHTPEHEVYRRGDSHLFSGDSLLIRGCR